MTIISQKLTDKAALLAKLEEEVRKLREELERSSISPQKDSALSQVTVPSQATVQEIPIETEQRESESSQPDHHVTPHVSESPQQETLDSPQSPTQTFTGK